MESTRALGYTVEAALADLIDNSISAGAKLIDLQFRPYDPPFLILLDDGNGMSSVELTAAMRYGSKNPLELRSAVDLGRFGLGLKTASLSQCSMLTVASIKDGILSARRWDLDYLKTRGDGRWLLLELNDKEIDKLPLIDLLKTQGKGTSVIWQNLDRLGAGESSFGVALGQKMVRVREHISLVFHRYITGERGIGKIRISINNTPIEARDPFLIGKSLQVMDEERIRVNNESILATPYILPHISNMSASEIKMLGGSGGLRRRQGFYVYRNKRLLVWGTWFRLMRQDDLSKLARVRVDIPNSLDHLWTLDIRKSIAVPPEIVRKRLSLIIEKIAEYSKKTWTFRGKKETRDSIVHLWNRLRLRDGVQYQINRDHPFAVALKAKLGKENQRLLEELLRAVESNIPLNQLYVDLNHDEKFAIEHTNGTDQKKSLEGCLELLLDGCPTKETKSDMVKRIRNIEPFSCYPELVDIILEEI